MSLKLRRFYFDMEMASYDERLHNVFPDVKKADHNIVSIVAYDDWKRTYHVFVYRHDLDQRQKTETRTLSDGKQYTIKFYYSGYETDTLIGFSELWRVIDPDVNLGWNQISFDWVYYINRCAKLNILSKVIKNLTPTRFIEVRNLRYFDIPGCESFDLLKGAKKILGRYVDGTLDAVSEKILNVGKLADTMTAVNAWQHDIEQLVNYNIRDVELTVRLDKEMPIYDYFREQMAMTGATFGDILMANYKVVQIYIMYMKHEHPFLEEWLTPTESYDKEKMGGAITLVPQVGIWDWVAVHDLSAMYPTIMLACNMSPETIVRPDDFTEEEWEAMNPIDVNGVYFRQDFEGFVPRLIRVQMELRRNIESNIANFISEYGDGYEHTQEFDTFMRKRTNVKNLINSWFGVFGYEQFYFYNNDISKSVTWLGQRQLEWSRDFVKKHYNITTLYGDTDSIFLFTPPHIISRGIDGIVEYHEEVGQAISASYDNFAKRYNISNHDFHMAFEKLYERLFFAKLKKGKRGAKKRYTGKIVYKDGEHVNKTDIMGFPVRRSDTAPVTSECQKKVFAALLESENPSEAAYNIIREYYIKVMKGGLDPNYVAIPRGFGRPMNKYKKANRTYHWWAAKWSNDNLGTNFDKNSKIRYIPLSYIPPPYNKLQWYVENTDKWMAFDTDHPLREEFKSCINWKMVADQTIYEKMVSIAESLGIDKTSIKTGLKQKKVMSGL